MSEISTRLKTVMATIAIVVLLLLLWQLHTLILLIFAAIIVAIVLRSMSQPLARQTGLDHRITLAICIALIVVVAAAVVTALGRLVSEELSTLSERLPAMFEQIEWIDFGAIADWIESKDWLGGKSIITSITGVSALLLSVAVNLVVVVMGAIYFAAGPRIYRTGFLKLLPPEQHEVAGETLTAVSESLRLFILGQLASMVAVGVLTTAGLLILGIPSAIALGILAGLLEFIPYVGPVAAAIPALIVALGESPWMALWVLILYILVQQVEAAILVPLIQRRAVQIPPGVTIFAIIAFGIVFGPMGVLLGAPATVVAYVLIQKLWVREELGEETTLPNERSSS